ncbi:hypothetical protein [Paraburkholderia sp. BL18I3N2]|uniref:hypothetical protein n=1 Tax=Paraburkholderia sp. BL18I3N2 TaxID=1938799 RepID=UPI0011B1E4CB|nr:hypothetical protein [Paraburkholderia sp. BL18I3N2]
MPLHKVARSMTLDLLRVAHSLGIDPAFEHDERVDVTGQIDLLAERVGDLSDNAMRRYLGT